MINDAFWCITLGTIVIAWFWKREKRRIKYEKIDRQKAEKKNEQVKQQEVIAKYTAAFGKPLTKAEQKAEDERIAAQVAHDKQVAELKKQGYTDELIAVIIPTINNGQ